MIGRVRRAAYLLLAQCALLQGCAHSPPNPATQALTRPLATPATLGSDRAANQVVRGAFGEREVTMNCVVSKQGNLLTVVGLTAMGVRAFTLKYDGQNISVENTLPVPSQMTPERLLADIQLVFWPLAALQPVLEKAGWQLTEPFSGTRRLRRGDTLAAEVHYDRADPWSGRSWLVNLEHSYTLGIDSTSLTAP
jgi:hypothetical protein